MRSIWSGAISFGLINIPINLYSATEEHALSFDMLHKKDLSPIRYARMCKEEDKEVPYEEIVKGYEYEKGEYIVVTDEDFKRAAKKSDTIDILEFSNETEIDTIYFEKPYYLAPGKGADKPYALLREALRKSKKVAIAKFVLRNREHLAVIKPYEDALVLNQLRFAAEVRALEGIKLPSAEGVNKKEMDLALKLIEQRTEKFNAEAYEDTYVEALKEVIEDKAKGISPKKKPKAEKPSKIHDIMSLLQASLKEKEAKPSAAARAKKKKAAVA